jgi:NAD-dependent deacetylase
MDDTALDRAAAMLAGAARVVALTGAGISAESGVPTFRGPGGLWRQYRPEDLATPQAFARDPALVWEWYRWRRSLIAGVEPNPGHDVLARWARRPWAFDLITQNVDGLHQRAGAPATIELHGSIWTSTCAAGCGYERDDRVDMGASEGTAAGAPDLPRCPCGALLRPGVVWFGEALDPARVAAAALAAHRAAVMVVVGTSALVYPAASLPGTTLRAGGAIIEVNVEATPLSAEATVVLQGPSAEVLPALEARL